MLESTPFTATTPTPEAALAKPSAPAPEVVIAGNAAKSATVDARVGRVRFKVVSTVAASSSRNIDRPRDSNCFTAYSVRSISKQLDPKLGK
jgi:hypothetical protein